LYLPYTSPHKPVIPLEQFRGQGKAGAYGEFMIETDHHLGRILKWLDDQKLAKDTMVIFTSDNGPEKTWLERINRFGHHSSGIYREGKRSIYEGGHRVPFLIRWPAQVKAGSKWNRPVCQTDLLATVAEMLGKRLPEN
jgi:arylsulfatase A